LCFCLVEPTLGLPGESQFMMGFGKPYFIGESTDNRLLVRVCRDVIVLVTAVCELGSLATSKLLQRRKLFFILSSLPLHFLPPLASCRIAKPIKELASVRRKESHIRINSEGGLK